MSQAVPSDQAAPGASGPPGPLPRPIPVPEAAFVPGKALPSAVSEAGVPAILRGFADHWPVVAAAKTGPEALRAYLGRFDRGATVTVTVGDPALGGRIFYDDAMAGQNARSGRSTMTELLDRVTRHGAQDAPPLIYLGSTPADDCLPGFRAENDIPFPGHDPLASVWIGTRTRIAAHNDLPRNLAVVAAGQRRFTLFPPNQTANLYPGPIENTPAGRPVSMVDFAGPDLERYPGFAEAMACAQVADLGPGDALFVPSMWWHHVEATAGVNMLVNYWWRTVPRHLGTPQDALNHAIMAIRDLPDDEKAIWQDAFGHYVFGDPERARAHLPAHAQGMLGEMTEDRARAVRAYLTNRLSR